MPSQVGLGLGMYTPRVSTVASASLPRQPTSIHLQAAQQGSPINVQKESDASQWTVEEQQQQNPLDDSSAEITPAAAVAKNLINDMNKREFSKDVLTGQPLQPGQTSSRVDQIKDDLDSTPTEVSGSEDQEVELKQGKLMRNKQVMTDTFDEWEEAYRLETEQRKIDEVFMREALGEARKAADRWEVPVGAVLVRDGKIIARGYNLVEDLRDCTAHAEMMCIREASKILQTWRLSDTTLYVTLEPCVMCAGAILQARTGTLVYGAPNKLLGADGSWIRVFPSVDKEGGSELIGKAGGPVHPFHQKMKIRRGILEAECADVMQQFFRLRRKTDKKTEQQFSKKLSVQLSRLLHKMHHVFHLSFRW